MALRTNQADFLVVRCIKKPPGQLVVFDIHLARIVRGDAFQEPGLGQSVTVLGRHFNRAVMIMGGCGGNRYTQDGVEPPLRSLLLGIICVWWSGIRLW